MAFNISSRYLIGSSSSGRILAKLVSSGSSPLFTTALGSGIFVNIFIKKNGNSAATDSPILTSDKIEQF